MTTKVATRKRTPHTSDARVIDDGKAATRKRTPHTSAARVIKGRRQSSYKEKDAPHISCKNRDDDKAATRKRTPHTSAARRETTTQQLQEF
jgi:hypothetical protein